MQRDVNRHNILEILSGKDFTLVSEVANEKYNNELWRSYADVAAPKRAKTWDMLVRNSRIKVMASTLDPYSAKPLIAKGGFETYGGKIPYMGIAGKIDQQDVEAKLEMEAFGAPLTPQIAKELTLDTLEDMYQAIHSKLKFFVLQGVSTGNIVVDIDNQVNGKFISIDLNIPAANKATVAKVWSDSTANPVQQLIDKQRYAKRTLNLDISGMHWEMSQELWDVFIMHPEVIKATTGRMNIVNADNYIVTDGEKQAMLTTLGIKPIVIVEESVAFDSDGESTSFNPFDTDNAVLLPNTPFFDLQNSPSYQSMLQTATAERSTVEGFITAVSMWDDKHGVNTIDMDAWAFPVPKDAKNILIVDTATATS
jgi:hypothetical protein